MREAGREPNNWAPNNAFSVEKCGIAVELLTLPSLAVIKIFEYL